MIKSIEITGYRGLADFSMSDLGRINLLVGKNNSGKTSVLEAIYFLMASSDMPVGGDLSAIYGVLSRRGEQINESPVPGRPYHVEIDPSHLFSGHALQAGSRMAIHAKSDNSSRSLIFEVGELQANANPALFAQLQAQLQMDSAGVASRYAINVTNGRDVPAMSVPLSSRGGIRQDVIQTVMNMSGANFRDRGGNRYQFIPTDSLSIQDVQAAFNQISLSPSEDLVIRALQFVEPSVERIAPSGGIFASGPGWPTRGGLKVKLRGRDEPIPIGSLGEGTWRLLAMAIALSGAKDGLLIIDEIDTGLHYTVLEKMWMFVAEVSKEFNIQVFATTHSGDCVSSLASVCHSNSGAGSEVTIQRIEADIGRSVSYTESEIVALAKNYVEVR